jgi:hypothetical protein
MSKSKENIDKARYHHCDNCKESDDIIFLYPSNVKGHPDSVMCTLQKIMDFAKNITDLNPTKFFDRRTVVGYRHPDDDNGQKCVPGWNPNWVNIPWDTSNINEVIDMCTHELIHPFFGCSPINDRNGGWGEGFCDFLRGPAKKLIGLDGDGWWRDMIKAAENNKDDEYHDPAGKFILKAYEEFGNNSFSMQQLIDRQEIIKEFIQYLFSNFRSNSLADYIKPSAQMRNKWQGQNKI